MTDEQERYVPNPDVVLREESDDWALLFDPSSGDVVSVNPVGAFIWKSLHENCSRDDIVKQVQSAFSDVPSNLIDEIDTFVNKLLERGFVGKVC